MAVAIHDVAHVFQIIKEEELRLIVPAAIQRLIAAAHIGRIGPAVRMRANNDVAVIAEAGIVHFLHKLAVVARAFGVGGRRKSGGDNDDVAAVATDRAVSRAEQPHIAFA
jgi:hypothetical protein